ncbi:50S ribosomal protein L15 [Candidatus Obscuribacterales bacterium]|nr:50S ribosomal protein L15 [Candidatus Obscuribacterales bacterium]MBX3138308.1 50S ribosomal protein L15 [Candidatus Obscuribacterales bacterium]MBX3154160.1 50S ribosomal protein L15 [Candidatus Obscuribacterales bacterium]
MKLNELAPPEGTRSKKKIVGRGRASGHGKTSTRGHNGQGQRSGEATRFGFEGGQTPLFRRLPKIHNFYRIEKRTWTAINVGDLNKLKAGSEVTPESLVEFGILRSVTSSLRVLGNGELKVSLKVKAHHFSQGAIDKITQAGGSYDVIQPAPRHRGRLPHGLVNTIKKESKQTKELKKESKDS